MALGTEAELLPSFTQERFILLRGHGKPRAVTILLLSAISHGNTPAEVHGVFLPRRILNRFARAVQAHGNYRDISQCSGHYARLSHMSSLDFREQNPVEITFRVCEFQA